VREAGEENVRAVTDPDELPPLVRAAKVEIGGSVSHLVQVLREFVGYEVALIDPARGTPITPILSQILLGPRLRRSESSAPSPLALHGLTKASSFAFRRSPSRQLQRDFQRLFAIYSLTRAPRKLPAMISTWLRSRRLNLD
jgi:hypothetical protein